MEEKKVKIIKKKLKEIIKNQFHWSFFLLIVEYFLTNFDENEIYQVYVQFALFRKQMILV